MQQGSKVITYPGRTVPRARLCGCGLGQLLQTDTNSHQAMEPVCSGHVMVKLSIIACLECRLVSTFIYNLFEYKWMFAGL